MKFSFAHDRVLAVMAHPDDAELLCAGTLARARAEGAAIGICIMCRGDKGMPAAAGQSIENLGDVRRKEAQEACELLGAQLLWFASPDGELFDSVVNRARLVEMYRAFAPTLVLAHCAQDYHPDHRSASALAEAASWFCASRGHVTDSPPLPSQPALWWCDAEGMVDFTPDYYIDVSSFCDLKAQMLGCHLSQLQRGGDQDFAPLMQAMIRQSQARGAQAGVAAAEAFQTHRAFKRARAW